MSKRAITYLVALAAAAAMLAAGSSIASASPATPASVHAKVPVVTIAMRDPGCHWFVVGGKFKARLVVHGTTAFRNLDEAALVFAGGNLAAVRHVGVGKIYTVSRPGTYHITMVGQHPDDNHLLLVVK